MKECYFYLDSTPTHSYMKFLYKYPQAAFPYAQLVEENRQRTGKTSRNSNCMDTGVFDDNRYFDVFVEYAKADPEDILIRITRRQSRAGSRDTARAADRLVPQHLVVGRESAAPASPSCER